MRWRGSRAEPAGVLRIGLPVASARLTLTPALLLLAGCSLLSGRENPFRAEDAARLSIVVENRNTESVLVEVLEPERRLGLGMVAGRGRAVYVIPWPEVQEVRFVITPPRGRSHTTTGIRVEPGTEIELWVQDPVEISVLVF
jgi:hypothetical protein